MGSQRLSPLHDRENLPQRGWLEFVLSFSIGTSLSANQMFQDHSLFKLGLFFKAGFCFEWLKSIVISVAPRDILLQLISDQLACSRWTHWLRFIYNLSSFSSSFCPNELINAHRNDCRCELHRSWMAWSILVCQLCCRPCVHAWTEFHTDGAFVHLLSIV